MHTVRRAPRRAPPVGYLCTQCRHATTTKTAKNRLALKATARDLAERSAILRHRVHSARQVRREDWMLGPLAPDRAAADAEFGCVNTRELNGVKGLERTRQGRSPYMAREMSWEDSLVEVGDRVVVVTGDGPAGRERGKVGVVSEVRKGLGECVVKGLNMANIKAPQAIRATEPNPTRVRPVALPLPLPLSAVRVVCKMTHSGGVPRDTIISKMIRLPNKPGRYIANSDRATGEWLRVPEKEAGPTKGKKEKKDPDEDEDAVTLRYEVEEETWTPTLLRAPMPGGVIDELRFKYSTHRTRHEPRYQLALENRERRKAEWKAWAKSGGSMLSSPAKEAAAKARDERAAGPKPSLKTEILEKIGEVMAQKGIVLTEQRQREMERNLMTEGVVSGAEGEVVKAKAEIVNDDEQIADTNANMDSKNAIDTLATNDTVIPESGREDGREARR